MLIISLVFAIAGMIITLVCISYDVLEHRVNTDLDLILIGIGSALTFIGLTLFVIYCIMT